MPVQEEVSILFPRISNQFSVENSFTINYMRSRVPSVFYFKVHCYDLRGSEILKGSDAFYVSQRMLIDSTWTSYSKTFNFSEAELNNLKEIQIELRFIGVDDDNPVYFTECLLMNKAFDGTYYETSQRDEEAEIGFINNRYANVYSNDDNYLQIIRPLGTKFTTKNLEKSECTVLAPHLVGETEYDKPINLYMEFINQTEQTTNIKSI